MARGKELLKNTGILMLAKISTQIVSFLLLPLYTSILSTEEYGQVDVYTSLSMIIIPFITLQVEMALFRYSITEKQQAERKEIVSTSFAVVMSMVTITSIIYWVVNTVQPFPFSGYLYAYYAVMTINTVLLQVSRAEGDNIGYGLATFISSAVAVVLNVLFIAVLRYGVAGILLSSIISHLISSLFLVYKTHVTQFLSFASVTKERCKKLLQYSIPLIFNQIASWAINYSDRLIILYRLGQSFNGIYSVACKFSNITSTFFGVYNVAWTESVVRSMDDNDGEQYVSRVFDLTFKIYIILITGIINLLPFIYTLLINEKFLDSYPHVPILLVGMMFSGMSATIGSIYIAYNKTKEVSITTMLAGLVNVIVHLVLINRCGLFAASISTLVAFGLLFIYRIIGVRKFYNLNIKWNEILGQLLILVIAWIGYSTQHMLIILIGFAINIGTMGYVIYKNKTVIQGLFRRHK